MSRQKKILSVFGKFYKRYCSIFFSKLVLFQTKQQYDQDTHIRHYDMECQAAVAIACVLNTKIKALSFKFLYSLKQQVLQKRLKAEDNNKLFRRSYIEKPNFSKKLRGVMSVSNLRTNTKETAYTAINLQSNKNSPQNQIEQIDCSIKNLMEKVKDLNIRNKVKTNSEYAYTERSQNKKLIQRKLILEKISRLESELQELLQQNSKIQFKKSGYSIPRAGAEYFQNYQRQFSPRAPYFTYSDPYIRKR